MSNTILPEGSSTRSPSTSDLFDGLIFLFFCTLHADQLGFTCAGFNIRVNNLLALVLFVLFFVRFRLDLVRIDKKFGLALLWITFSISLSLLFSPYKTRCFIFMGWYGLTLLCYVLLPYFLLKKETLRKIFSLYCASFIAVGSYAFLQLILSLMGIQDPFAEQRIVENIVRPNAFAYEPSFYALYMTPFVMMCNFHFLSSPQKPFFFPKKLTVTKILFINALYVVSTSTSTFFAYALFFVLVLAIAKVRNFQKRVFKFIATFALTTCALFAAVPFLIKNFFMKFFFFGFLSHHSFYQRWTGIANAWNVFLENIFLGVGLGGCPAYLYDAWLLGNKKYFFYETYLMGLDWQNSYFKHFEPMNVFTELLASLGIVGAVAFFYLIFVIYFKARQAFKNAPSLSMNLFVSLFVMLFVLQFNQGILRTYVWTHIALSFGLLEIFSLPLTANETFQNWGEKRPELGSF